MSTDRYLPIYATNNWGVDTWWIGNPKDDTGHAWACTRTDPNAIRLPLDGYIDALFPDGTEERVRIQTESRSVAVGDMGRSYDVGTTIPCVYATAHGAPVKIPMAILRVDPDSLREKS